ncbi:hypothetical protein [Methanosalsum natronophilum]|uniref:hypothetical protein n=1 Tax=Methanosalsum natronophilum TaxID=768733 RepID=UPI002168E23D|nr:hypothetical protein [Methanosalsum natronophilum]MCS3924845.1 hypothetical protein [Methanosalsum natronophilum]
MSKYVLIGIDTVGIQKYIFGSNNLKQIVGASGLVHWATNELVVKQLVALGKDSTNVYYDKNLDKVKYLENTIEDGLISELVYVGGGNTFIIFKELEHAEEFSRNFTKEVLLNASGLEIIITHTEFDWDANDLAEKTIPLILKKLRDKKYQRKRSSNILGLGITANCQYTGLPAIELRNGSLTEVLDVNLELINGSKSDPMNKSLVRVSKNVSDKLRFYKRSEKRFMDMFPNVKDRGYEFIHNFGDFGTKNESSFIAVVHADGNDMGKRVQAITSTKENRESNRKYIDAIRKFSLNVENTTISTIVSTIDQLLESIDTMCSQTDDEKLKETIEGMIRPNDKSNSFKGFKKLLPFRPIIVGGDDLTFVCDGRLGLTLTELYLENLKKAPKLSDGKPISAKAGIAIVNSHYPFTRAVELAESLASSAKDILRDINKEDVSSMDWHFGSSGTLEGLDNIRNNTYTVNLNNKLGKLHMRPVFVGDPGAPKWRTWDNFCKIISEFKGEEWSKRKNKLKTIREKLPEGPDSVEKYLQFYELDEKPGLPEIPNNPATRTSGWIGDTCTCFDAIEALDFFIPLQGDQK